MPPAHFQVGTSTPQLGGGFCCGVEGSFESLQDQGAWGLGRIRSRIRATVCQSSRILAGCASSAEGQP